MAVGLDDQPFRPPDEVDLERSTGGVDPRVDPGLGDASRAAKAQEALLELTACKGLGEIAGCENLTKSRSATTPGRVRKKIADRACVQNSKHLCLVERTLQASTIHDLSQIEERACYRGARNPTHLRDILRPQPSRPVPLNPSTRAF
jgi:hypothetical protein